MSGGLVLDMSWTCSNKYAGVRNHRRVHPRDWKFHNLHLHSQLAADTQLQRDGLQLDHPTYRENTSLGHDEDASTNKVQLLFGEMKRN